MQCIPIIKKLQIKKLLKTKILNTSINRSLTATYLNLNINFNKSEKKSKLPHNYFSVTLLNYIITSANVDFSGATFKECKWTTVKHVLKRSNCHVMFVTHGDKFKKSKNKGFIPLYNDSSCTPNHTTHTRHLPDIPTLVKRKWPPSHLRWPPGGITPSYKLIDIITP